MVVAVVLVVVGGGRDGRNVLADIGCRVKIGTLIVRIGFWAVLYYSYNKQPQYTIGNYSGLYITSVTLLRLRPGWELLRRTLCLGFRGLGLGFS